MSEELVKICPTTSYRYDGIDSYLYRSFDGVSWSSELLKHPLSWPLIRIFREPITVESAIEQLSNKYCFSKDDIFDAISGLIECDILIKSNDARFIEHNIYNSLNEKNNSIPKNSSNYHIHTSFIDKINYSDPEDAKSFDNNKMDEYVRDESVPSNYHKSPISTPAYSLSQFIPINYHDLSNKKTTCFSPGSEPYINEPSLDDLNFLINVSFAQTGNVNMIGTGEHIRKAVPSGGARHPIETYIISNDTKELDRGLYHYNVKNHRLDKMNINQRSLEVLSKAVSILPRSRNKKLSFGFIQTCRFERSMFRYRESRSYRVMNFDLGHINANLTIGARLLNLNFGCSFSIPENEVESVLKLNPFVESAMSSFSVYQNGENKNV